MASVMMAGWRGGGWWCPGGGDLLQVASAVGVVVVVVVVGGGGGGGGGDDDGEVEGDVKMDSCASKHFTTKMDSMRMKERRNWLTLALGR